MAEPRFTPYHPRRLASLGLVEAGGFRLKRYSIVFGDEPHDAGRFDGLMPLALAELPSPAIAEGRPGVGFAILHRGRTADYVVLGWWDRENEVPIRVFVSDTRGPHAASGGEGMCVWDLRVVWWEREAYVRTMLADRPADVEAYLAARIEGFA